jgi:nucleoside-diphosphate-sugar epimerase
MRVFVTGATGWVGAAVVEELIGAGHEVEGLVRTPDKARALAAAGASPVEGALGDLDILKDAASRADAVVHTAFQFDFARMAENGAQEEAAIAAMGEALEGTDRPLIVTSGVAALSPEVPGAFLDETTPPRAVSAAMPRDPEGAAARLRARGVRAAVVRLPPTVHGHGDHGFVPGLIATARRTGVSAHVEAGANRWPAVHRRDAARAYRLAVERGAPLPTLHAIAEEAVPLIDIARVIAARLGVPLVSLGGAEAEAHFGPMVRFIAADCPARADRTRQALGWTPREPGLLADLDHPAYFAA